MLEKTLKNITELGFKNYNEYLYSQHWREFRLNFLQSKGFKCEVCGIFSTSLNVHHKSYKRIGREQFNDVKALCEDCHKEIHKPKLKIKKTYDITPKILTRIIVSFKAGYRNYKRYGRDKELIWKRLSNKKKWRLYKDLWKVKSLVINSID